MWGKCNISQPFSTQWISVFNSSVAWVMKENWSIWWNTRKTKRFNCVTYAGLKCPSETFHCCVNQLHTYLTIQSKIYIWTPISLHNNACQRRRKSKSNLKISAAKHCKKNQLKLSCKRERTFDTVEKKRLPSSLIQTEPIDNQAAVTMYSIWLGKKIQPFWQTIATAIKEKKKTTTQLDIIFFV